MKGRKHLLYICAFLGCIPLALCVPYIIKAWRISPLDQRDFVFAISFAVSAIFPLVITGHSEPVFQKRILLADLTLLWGFVFCRIISLNSGAIICAIMFWWVHIWLLRGIKLAFNLLPSFMILLLATVSSTYWMCVSFGVMQAAAFRIKVLATFLLLIAEALILRYAWQPRIGVIIFSLAMSVATAVMLMLGNLTKTYVPCKLAFQPVVGNFIGIEMDKDKGFRRFFNRSEAHHYKYSGNTADFTLLTVDCGNDIHEIHPASHCLRTSGWTIEDENLHIITIDEKALNVTEIKASKRQAKILLWVWYTNESISTGNFICFRRLWRNGRQWSTYQLGIIGGRDLEDSRSQLMDILTKIMVK